jgi:adenylate kinase family enzyme
MEEEVIMLIKKEENTFKIRILGVPGSGKSFFSNQLEEQLQIEHFDLDDIFWVTGENNYRARNSKKNRESQLQDIFVKNNWIIDGVYLGEWNYRSFYEADYIINIKINPILQYYRIIKRHFQRKILGTLPKSSLHDLKELIIWSTQYKKDLDTFFSTYIDKNKLIELKSKEDREIFLSVLEKNRVKSKN